MTIHGKTVLVTGASRGIGRALVDEALSRGAARVYAGARQPTTHPDEHVTALRLDVTDPAQIRAAAGSVEFVDLLINNAGVQPVDDLSDPAALEQALAVNLFGIYRVTQAFLPSLRRSRGTIVNNVSLAAIAPMPFAPGYSISKAAAFSLTQSLRMLLARQGVNVHSVLTGPTDTEMTRDLHIPKASPESVAQAIFDGVENGEEDIFPDPLSPSSSSARTWPSCLSRRKRNRCPVKRSSAGKSGRRRVRSCSGSKNSTPAWATSWHAGAASCPGSRSRKITCSTPTTVPRSLAELFDGRAQLVFYHFMFGPTYTAGCPVNSSIADALDGLLPHLNARDVTLTLVSSAPMPRLRAFKQRMGWSLPWVSSANSDFNRDVGAAFTPDRVRGWAAPIEDTLPPIVRQNATATGTDVIGYLSEAPAVTVFAIENGVVYQTYATSGRGVEFMMPYYPILDRVPKGRDEGDSFQTWIRRHDEYV
jgi:predicted dithiol-disulfide oxidoreductase (DUF899 family)/NAD(P)-dependent dehydrogenase (short-subunit alcohol dehydrogenase family)